MNGRQILGPLVLELTLLASIGHADEARVTLAPVETWADGILEAAA